MSNKRRRRARLRKGVINSLKGQMPSIVQVYERKKICLNGLEKIRGPSLEQFLYTRSRQCETMKWGGGALVMQAPREKSKQQ